jgi:hypothetical protein
MSDPYLLVERGLGSVELQRFGIGQTAMERRTKLPVLGAQSFLFFITGFSPRVAVLCVPPYRSEGRTSSSCGTAGGKQKAGEKPSQKSPTR